MKFLKILATPFIKLWNWIKQTAWVQPLLIVGCIFGVIFSIPYIAQGIKNASSKTEDTMKFYKDNSFSLKKAFDHKSEADEFLKAYADAQASWTSEDKTAVNDFKSKYGEKFFFTFVGSECDACEQFSEGFKYLEKNTKDFALEGEFKLHSIIVDEKIEKAEEKEYVEKSPYKFLFDNNVKAFENIYEAGVKGPYYTSNLTDIKDYSLKLQTMVTSDTTMEVPLVCLIDLTESNKEEFITTQVFYNITGDSKIDKAQYLADAWNYEGKTFGKN